MALQDLQLKVCVSKLPPFTPDELVLKMLQTCGHVKDWYRFKNADGQPKDGGVVEFGNVESVFACVKFLNNLVLKDHKIMEKTN